MRAITVRSPNAADKRRLANANYELKRRAFPEHQEFSRIRTRIVAERVKESMTTLLELLENEQIDACKLKSKTAKMLRSWSIQLQDDSGIDPNAPILQKHNHNAVKRFKA